MTRPALDVMVRHLPTGGATFATNLIEGATLAVAASAAFSAAPDFDLAANIAGLLDAGAFTRIRQGSRS